MKKEEQEYSLSFDIGTNSVGWSVTDSNLQLIKKGNKHMWGAETFETANTAQERRNFRSTRRRYNKARERTLLLENIFKEYIAKEDPTFFTRLKKMSFLDFEDKKRFLENHGEEFKKNYNLFYDDKYTDKDFFREYPTIYHLRKALCKSNKKEDLRKIVLVLNNIYTHRGNFLYEGQNFNITSDNSNKEDDLKYMLETICLLNDVIYNFTNNQLHDILNILTKLTSKKSKTDELKEYIFNHIEIDSNFNKFNNSKQSNKSKKTKESKNSKIKLSVEQNSIFELLKGIIGCSFNIDKLYVYEEFKDDNNKDITLNFSDKEYEKNIEELENILNDKIEFIDEMQKFFSWLELKEMLGSDDVSLISYAMVNRYEEHKTDLKKLKTILSNAGKLLDFDYYYEMFFKNDRNVVNYYNYINKVKLASYENIPLEKDENGVKEESYGDDDLGKFYNYSRYVLKTILKQYSLKYSSNFEKNKVVEQIQQDIKDIHQLLDKMDNHTFLLKQKTVSNSAIPYQMHKAEMEIILNKQQEYYPFIKENKNKLISILEFKVPYYYGPLDGNESFGWLVKQKGKENERILPWNHAEIVDQEATAKKFIERLISHCTYLPNEKVMPKNSLTCSKYEIYSELNKVRVNDKLLDVNVKNQIFDELFAKQKSVSKKTLEKWIKNHIYLFINTNTENITITGLQKEEKFVSSLTPWIDFSKIFNVSIEQIACDTELFNTIEEIIEDITIFKEKDILNKRLKKYDLTKQQLNNIFKLNYNGWSKLSRKLINSIKSNDSYNSYNLNTTGYTILDIMNITNLNLMEIINRKEYDFKQIIDNANQDNISFKLNQNNQNNPNNQNSQNNAISNKMLRDIVIATYGSPALKRAILSTLKTIEEIKHYMGCEPKNIFVEFARNEDEKVSTNSRKKKLTKLYNDLDKAKLLDEHAKKIKKQLSSEKELSNNQVYLYYLQLGRCMYSYEKISRDKLLECEIDHIIPRTLKTDNSIDNIVLVKKEENQRKSDAFVLPSSIRNKMMDFWQMLKTNDVISQNKFYRLIRTEFSQNQINGFLNRQLVETRQITKNVVNIIKGLYPNTQVFSIRAEMTSQFRKKYDIPKNREVNDFHHAHDAYIISVVGQYIQKRFPKLEAHFEYGKYFKNFKNTKNSKNTKSSKITKNNKFNNDYSFVINSMDYDYVSDDNKEIWNSSVLKDILKCFQYKDIYTTKKLDQIDGQFYNQRVYSNAVNRKKGEPFAAVPLNKYRKDVEKYGGYSSLNYDIVAIEGIVRNKKGDITKKVRKISQLPTLLRNSSDKEKIEYIEKNLNIEDVKILKYFKKNQLIEIENIGKFYIRSASEVIPAQQLILTEDESETLYKMSKTFNNLNNLNDFDISDINKLEDNVIQLYYSLCNKFDTLYPNFNKFSNIKNKLLDNKDKFIKLNIEDKYKVINEILKVFQNNASRGNLKLVSLGDAVGRLNSITLNLDDIIFYDVSVTGIYSSKYKL